jgi:hypothetical protein
MKKALLSVVSACLIATAVALVGCASAPPALTPAQIAGILCVPAQNAITQFQTIDATLSPIWPQAATASAALAKAKPVVTAACTASSSVSVASAQALINTGLPALAAVAAALPLDPVTLGTVQDAFNAAEIAAGIATVFEETIAEIQAAKAAGAASAPVAASAAQ